MTEDRHPAASTAFHTVLMPPERNGGSSGGEKFRLAGLRFDDVPAADEFYRQLVRLGRLELSQIGALQGGAAAGGNRKGKNGGGGGSSRWSKSNQQSSKGGGKSKGTRPKSTTFSKADISQPCCFTHVTRLERGSTTAAATAVNDGATSRSAPPPRPTGGNGFAALRPGHGPVKLHS
jgi:hypothetical protein